VILSEEYYHVLDELLSFLASSGASHRIAVMDDETAAIEGAMTTALRRV